MEQKLKHYEAAAGNLRLYRLAVPDALPSPQDAAPSVSTPTPEAAAPATVLVYWPPEFGMNNNPNRLQCDGSVIAKLQKGRFIVLRLKPGFHTLDFQQQVSLDFVAGREYYVRASYEGFFKHKALRIVTRERWAAEMQKDKIRPGDADHVFDPTCSGGDALAAP